MAEETQPDKEEKVVVVAKRPADVQRIKLEKLMKNPVRESCFLHVCYHASFIWLNMRNKHNISTLSLTVHRRQYTEKYILSWVP